MIEKYRFKLNTIIGLNFFFSFCFLLFLQHKSYAQTNNIVAGMAKLTGKITIPDKINKDSIFVNITIPHPISGEFVKYKTLVDANGKFFIDAEVETTFSFIHFSTSLTSDKPLLVKLTSGIVTNIDIIYNSTFEIENIDVKPAMNKDDMRKGFDLIGEMIEYRPNRAPKSLYDKSTDDFLLQAKTFVSERLTILNNYPSISNELKEMLSKDFRLFMYSGHVFDYEGEMASNYRNTTNDKAEKPIIKKIDKSYFRFLKDFKLNDSQYLSSMSFLEFQNEILQNEVISLPKISENDIPTWLKNIKAILADLVGFDKGQHYDILAANSYGKQLVEELKPLSEKQKENVKNYWGEGEIAKILFRKNLDVVKLDKFKVPVKINDVTTIAPEKVIETIVSRYKNKVILIDLWATWCAPCLSAMNEFRNTKNELISKDVVFIYLTNPSSPQKLWEEKLKK